MLKTQPSTSLVSRLAVLSSGRLGGATSPNDQTTNPPNDQTLRLSCPRSWKEMTQEQLRYALHVIGCGMYSSVEGRTLMLLRFTGIEVMGRTPGGWACSVPVGSADGKKEAPLLLPAALAGAGHDQTAGVC